MSRTLASLFTLASLLMPPAAVATPVANDDGSAVRMRHWVEALCAPKLEGRRFTTPGALRAARYVASQFEALGLQSLAPKGATPYLQAFPQGHNVLGLLRAKSPHRTGETVIVQAHFDHLGPMSPGASDNAAGVAIVLELARELAAHPERLTRDVLFASFDGEEMGWVGASAYAKQPAVPLAKTVAFVNMDAMGRTFCDLPEKRLVAFGAEHSPELLAQLQSETAAHPDITPLGTDLIGDRSDYVPFQNAQVPYLFFFNGTHKDYHDHGDTPDKVDYEWLASDSKAIRDAVLAIASGDVTPKYHDPVALPGEAALVKGFWREVHPKLAGLPAHYRREVPGLDQSVPLLEDPVSAGGKDRATLSRALTLVTMAATPWYGQLMACFEEGAALEQKGDLKGAIAVYRRGLTYSHTYAGITILTARIKTLSAKAGIKPPSLPTVE